MYRGPGFLLSSLENHRRVPHSRRPETGCRRHAAALSARAGAIRWKGGIGEAPKMDLPAPSKGGPFVLAVLLCEPFWVQMDHLGGCWCIPFGGHSNQKGLPTKVTATSFL